MIAEFAVYPLGKTHHSQTIAEVVKEVQKSGLEYQVGPMGTSIEGEMEKVFQTLQNCFRVLYQSNERVLMNVSVDNKPTPSLNELEDRVESVMKKI